MMNGMLISEIKRFEAVVINRINEEKVEKEMLVIFAPSMESAKAKVKEVRLFSYLYSIEETELKF